MVSANTGRAEQEAKMAKEQRQPQARVRRITVDERLAEDLIRLGVCPLAEGVEFFFDRSADWGDEAEEYVGPGDYADVLGLSSGEDRPWESFSEGQVFLSGEFEVVGERRAPKYFQVSRGQAEFLRIDNLRPFRGDAQRTYSELLRRR
jgi:hypothetical protein